MDSAGWQAHAYSLAGLTGFLHDMSGMNRDSESVSRLKGAVLGIPLQKWRVVA